MGVLYVVATPIGNMEDVTLRALRILREVPLIAAEDTRNARILLKRHGIEGARVTSYNDHNEQRKTPEILHALASGDVALVTDAGTPGISDPGHTLVAAAIASGHDVVPIPGASAVIAAVVASGLPARRFHYLGFLPKQAAARRRALAEAAGSGDTIVVYESPHRVGALLADGLAVLGDRRIAVCRELTKLHEEIWRGPISGAIAHFTAPRAGPRAGPRGEFTIVIEGVAPAAQAPSAEDVARAITHMRAEGSTAKDAVAALTRDYHLSRREAYRRWNDTTPK